MKKIRVTCGIRKTGFCEPGTNFFEISSGQFCRYMHCKLAVRISAMGDPITQVRSRFKEAPQYSYLTSGIAERSIFMTLSTFAAKISRISPHVTGVSSVFQQS